MLFDKLTWVGFMIVALGWALLLSAPQLVELLPAFTGHSNPPLSIPAIAQSTILSGFGIALLGVLQTGFGALNRFFDSVLERNLRGRAHTGARPAQKKVVERGWLKNRAYVLFTDGSVEVETMLGRRIFPSLQEAQEFIA
jgi:hypothetical protein